MWDDQHDKKMMRNQMIGIIIMAVVFLAWSYYFMPDKTAPPPEEPVERVAPVVPEEAPDPVDPRDPGERAPQDLVEIDVPDELPLLPEPPEQVYDDQFEVTIENGGLRLVFTRVGARLKRAYVLLGDNGDRSLQLVPKPPPGMADIDTVYPLELVFPVNELGNEVNRALFEVEETGNSATFSVRIPGQALITKTFTLAGDNLLQADVSYENLGGQREIVGMDQDPAYILKWTPNVDSGDKTKAVRQAIVWRTAGENEYLETRKLGDKRQPLPPTRVRNPEWGAIRSAYFAVAMRTVEEDAPFGIYAGNEEVFQVGLAVPRFEVGPGQRRDSTFEVYIGPNQRDHLATAWETLPTLLRFFQYPDFLDWFAKLLLRILNWFHDNTIANYGIGIILLTLLTRIVLYPLTLKSIRSMKKMQLLAPEIQELKAKYGEDQQEMNRRMMELYRERGVNPMGGCMPMVVQMPVLIALWRMIWCAFELRGAPFLWIDDLSEPDMLLRLPFMEQFPFFGERFLYLNVLPLLSGGAMILQQKLSPATGPAQNQQQKMMMTIMPIFMVFLFYNFAAGLNLYILTGTLFQMGQNYLVKPGELPPPKKKKGPAKKKQHFYTAAKARQRELARESRKKKRE